MKARGKTKQTTHLLLSNARHFYAHCICSSENRTVRNIIVILSQRKKI